MFTFPFGWYSNAWFPWPAPVFWLDAVYGRPMRAMFGLPW